MAYLSYPETKEEWWRLVDENWAELLAIMHRFLPTNSMWDLDNRFMDHPLSVEITNLKEIKSNELARYFQAAWSAAPIQPWLREIPKWFLFCDLCAEDHVLYEEE